MATNNQKFKYWGLILNAPNEKATNPSEISDFFTTAVSSIQNYNKVLFFASKIHDKDILEDGTPKTIHLHIMLETYETYTQLQALKEFSNALNVDKKLISLKGSNNLYLLVQYLTHKNDQNKAQYNFSEILTNNSEYLEELYNTEYVDRETQLKDALRNAITIDDFIDRVGVMDANKLKGLFKELKIEQGQDFKTLYEKLGEIERDYISLYNFTDNLLMALKMGLKDTEKRLINFDKYEAVFINGFKKLD